MNTAIPCRGDGLFCVIGLALDGRQAHCPSHRRSSLLLHVVPRILTPLNCRLRRKITSRTLLFALLA